MEFVAAGCVQGSSGGSIKLKEIFPCGDLEILFVLI